MNLNQIVESDLSFTLEDSENGFGYELKLIDDNLNEYDIVGKINDIGFFIDLASGVGITGRNCEITVRISSLTDIPRKNWKCIYTDINNNTWTCYIADSPKIDRTLGIYLILLEASK